MLGVLRDDLAGRQGLIDSEERSSGPGRALISIAQGLAAAFDALAAAVTTAGKDGAYPPLVSAALREGLHSQAGSFSHVLHVAIEAAAGETITRRKLFGRSGRVVFVGGCQVSYILHDLKVNRAVAAGTSSPAARLQYDLGNGDVGTAALIPLSFVSGGSVVPIYPGAGDYGSQPLADN